MLADASNLRSVTQPLLINGAKSPEDNAGIVDEHTIDPTRPEAAGEKPR